MQKLKPYEVIFPGKEEPIQWGSFASLQDAVADVTSKIKNRCVVRQCTDWTNRVEIKPEVVKRNYNPQQKPFSSETLG